MRSSPLPMHRRQADILARMASQDVLMSSEPGLLDLRPPPSCAFASVLIQAPRWEDTVVTAGVCRIWVRTSWDLKLPGRLVDTVLVLNVLSKDCIAGASLKLAHPLQESGYLQELQIRLPLEGQIRLPPDGQIHHLRTIQIHHLCVNGSQRWKIRGLLV